MKFKLAEHRSIRQFLLDAVIHRYQLVLLLVLNVFSNLLVEVALADFLRLLFQLVKAN